MDNVETNQTDLLFKDNINRFNDFDITISVYKNNSYKFNQDEELDIMCGYLLGKNTFLQNKAIMN